VRDSVNATALCRRDAECIVVKPKARRSKNKILNCCQYNIVYLYSKPENIDDGDWIRTLYGHCAIPARECVDDVDLRPGYLRGVKKTERDNIIIIEKNLSSNRG